MTEEVRELLNLFIIISSNDHNAIQNASTKLINLSNKPNYSLNLLWIVVNSSIEDIYRFSAGIQLKNIIDKNWQRGTNLTESDKEIIKVQILSCAISSSQRSRNLYNVLAEIISKISRVDWNKKWPNLFNDLFNNNAWFIIYRVCQTQAARRLSQGIVLFKELAIAMSGEIQIKWKEFISNFNEKHLSVANSIGMEAPIHNVCYQLKTVTLFIRYTQLLVNEDEHFCKIIHDISLEMCSCFPYFIKYYHESISSMSNNFKITLYKLLKSMIWVLLSFQNKSISKFRNLYSEIQNFGLKVIFQSDYLSKSDRLSLLIFNLMLKYLEDDCKIRSKNPIFDIQIIDFIRSKYLIFNDEDIENIDHDPEILLECKLEKEDSIIIYNADEVIENMMVELVKGSTARNFNDIAERILIIFNGLDSLSVSEVEASLHFIGIVIQSSYYSDSANAKRYSSFLHCPTIIERVIHSVINRKVSYISEPWKNYLFRRCVWLYSRWVVDDVNIGTVSADRLASTSQWCFKAAESSSLGVIVKLEVCLYIEHIVEALEKLPSDFTDSETMHNIFLNPAITTIVSVLDHTSSSDTHTRLIDILIKLFHGTNMWSNIDLVKTCANSVYKLWVGINRSTRDTVILRDRLLECLSTVVKACDPGIIQPILATLSSFVFDSLNLIVSNGNAKIDNCLVLLDNTLQLWHDILYNSEMLFVELDNIYSLILSPIGLTIELDKNQTTLVLEIIQAHFLLKVLGNLNKESFSLLTLTSWTHIMHQSWDPKQEEDLCVMRIQLFDLWLLGFQQLSKEPLTTLFEMDVYCQFLCDRTRELLLTTLPEPSTDLYPSITNGVLTVLARLCLCDRVLLKRIIDFLSSNEMENEQYVVGILDRWLLRLDNQASNSVQQLFVLASIHWMTLCYEFYPTRMTNMFGEIINSCIQVCSQVPINNTDQDTVVAKAMPVPAERHLRLAYLVWNPLSDCSRIRALVTTFASQLSQCLGPDKFQTLFHGLSPLIQRQFIDNCTVDAF